jgi:glutamyl-tRNA synthetase
MEYYFVDEVTYQEKAVKKAFKPEAANILEDLLTDLESLESFEPQTLEAVIRDFAEQKELKLGKVAQPIRVALTGGTASPGLFEVMTLCGKILVIKRIRKAIEWIRAST